ncbi:MAG: ShlB/FhaC/HecB family hemolysin secretion/activation protein [Cyanobacteria bacterium J06649_4]
MLSQPRLMLSAQINRCLWLLAISPLALSLLLSRQPQCLKSLSRESRVYAQTISPENQPNEELPNIDDILPRPNVPELPSTLPPEDESILRRETEPEAEQTEPNSTGSPDELIDSNSAPRTADTFLVGAIALLNNTIDPTTLTLTVDGQTVSVADRIASIEGQRANLDELLALRTFITQAYLEAGYITSGAFIPEQDFTDGEAIRIQVVEGDLESLEIDGLSRLREGYVRDRLRFSPPLNRGEIEIALLLLQSDPLIDVVNAQLLTGSGPGLSNLIVSIEESPAFDIGLSLNNNRSPSVGSEQIEAYASYTNILGIGDRLDASTAFTQGLNNYALGYTIPISPQNGTLALSAASGNSRIISGDFDRFNISNDSRTFSVGVRQPLLRTPNREVALGLAFDVRNSQTFINPDQTGKRPFPISAGANAQGESRVSVIRFSQDWINRTPTQVLAARSQLSLGVDAFDATINSTGPDGEFFSWLGQFQWVQQLPKEQLLIARFSTQLTPHQLLSLEQFSLGGVNTVRGYRENQLVTDNGITGSVELRLPLTDPPEKLQIAPFIEGGIGWNNGDNRSTESTAELASIGTGLIWQIDPNIRARIDYGYPLLSVEGDGNSLQASGFYFSLDWSLR